MEIREKTAKWLASVIENGEAYDNYADMEWSEFACGANGLEAVQKYREAMLELADQVNAIVRGAL